MRSGFVKAADIFASPGRRLDAEYYLGRARRPMTQKMWESDKVQFPRLIAAIKEATVSISLMQRVCVLMRLKEDEVWELFGRADKARKEIQEKYSLTTKRKKKCAKPISRRKR